MGIDLEKQKRGRRKLTRRAAPRSKNVYLSLLHKLYSFLSRRTNSSFNKVIAKRLAMSNQHRPPVSIASVAVAYQRKVAQPSNNGNKDMVVTVAGSVLDDQRILTLPEGLKLCCLRISESARNKIIQYGGEVITFDQLALREPLGKNTLLLRGPLKARKAYRFFNGAPRVRAKGRKFERGKLHGAVKRNKKYRKKN
mmetsp:Transcript_55557/g.92379  ORF Transcript_55557/g.92379 Transcript_55557/m.92379 type:complete len:196 (-) Transcript_55557:1383-1970(-)|eukprot:CAMPEP_0202694170 /NCGR_PEP_ID=MMETSP1385-20130828/8093_1 /ASSEMBLY_ACC=CAM_ASM_000861 /TAXON_ID=933848 /ORGANISM="Elphidium margaritaceum" /LENGTH=195 /DNA_ID=CAMNT_0049349969 /DNA_START=128 /DNA_END=715 /DNA_ORIENTATION=-